VLNEVAALGPLDVLVHNAATGVIRPALEVEERHWDWTLNANARALLSLAQAAAPTMPRGASIVALSSLGSTRVLENYVLVGTSKAALEALVRYLAVELAPRGVRVNAVSPGFTRTVALEAGIASGAMNKPLMEHYAAMGRMVEPVEIAQAIAWLLSPASSAVTGINLPVDCGFLAGSTWGAYGGLPQPPAS
jgi:NAD(P)-dependent dehydrogenase (short-subunit alcohol dehydrogenase family)